MRVWKDIKQYPVVDGWYTDGNFRVKVGDYATIGDWATIGDRARLGIVTGKQIGRAHV